MIRRGWVGLGLCLACAAWCVHAQERDPTVAPPEVGTSVAADPAQKPWGAEGMAVVVRNAKPFLVVDTRLYAVGQKVGAFQVERITETEVWLRTGTTVHKVARFAGVVRREVATEPASAASAPPSKAKSRKARTMNKKATSS